jgi:hypothetical protein
MLMHNPSMRLTAQELGDGILNVQLRAEVCKFWYSSNGVFSQQLRHIS